MRALRHSALVCVLSLAAACSDGSSDDATPTSGSSKEIGSSGGTVVAGAAAVDVPEGALESSTKITVAESDVAVDPPDGYVLAGPAIAFTPHGLSFQEPVTLTLPYSSSAQDLAVLRLDDEQDKSWEVVEGGEFARGKAMLDVTSFSIYAVAEESSAPSGMGGAGGAADSPGETAGAGGAGDSAGAPPSGGASGGGDLVRTCEGTDPTNGFHTCSETTWPAMVVEILGAEKVPNCVDPAVAVDACDTTDAVLGCRTTDADGIAGLTVINWFYTGTAQQLMDGVFCKEANSEFIDPP